MHRSVRFLSSPATSAEHHSDMLPNTDCGRFGIIQRPDRMTGLRGPVWLF